MISGLVLKYRKRLRFVIHKRDETALSGSRHFFLHLACLRQYIAIEPPGLGIGHTIPENEPQEAHKRQPVKNLILNLVVGKVA